MNNDQQWESYVPVYDVIPENWPDARPALIEQLRKITTAVNIRVIGWLITQQTLNGKAFSPSATQLANGQTSQQFRSVISLKVDFPGLSIGLNSAAHNIIIDSNFTLVSLNAAGTNETTLTGGNLPNVTYDATYIYITVTSVYTRAYAFIEFLQEL